MIGSLIISNRLTEGTMFSEDDLRLLETLANQAAVALENGHLEQSLAELSRLKEQLRHQAYHDPLTGLPNRTLFLEKVVDRISRPTDKMPVVLFLDLDDFKVVNDTLGHAAGDRLLFDVAARLRTVLRTEDVAARLGGDEFAVLLEDDPGLSESEAVAHRIIEAMRVAFSIDGHDTTIGASIGIAAARLGTERADELLRNADVAMYTAKASGKNRVSVFEPTMHAAIVERHALSAELSRSLGQGELRSTTSRSSRSPIAEVTGMEALVRWRHPVRGLIGPGEFVHLAEENGMILPLGRWVLSEAVPSGRGMVQARADRPAPDDVGEPVRPAAPGTHLRQRSEVHPRRERADAVAAGPRDDRDRRCSTTRRRRSRASRPSATLASGSRSTTSAPDTHRSATCAASGSTSSRSLVSSSGLRRVEEEWAFAGAIVALGRTLGLSIIAEGIEEPGQYRRLHELGCEYGQGYLFSRPQEADAMTEMLMAQRPLREPRRSASGIRAASSALTIDHLAS